MYRERRRADEPAPARRVPWWRLCEACRREFRWQRAWKGSWALSRPPLVWFTKFVCRGCAPGPEQARPFFGIWQPPRPAGAAPPPSPALSLSRADVNPEARKCG